MKSSFSVCDTMLRLPSEHSGAGLDERERCYTSRVSTVSKATRDKIVKHALDEIEFARNGTHGLMAGRGHVLREEARASEDRSPHGTAKDRVPSAGSYLLRM